jgi:putative transposase
MSRPNRETRARFLCVECGCEGDADADAALNIIMARGRRAAARGEPARSGRPVRQEPDEASGTARHRAAPDAVGIPRLQAGVDAN